MTIPKTELELRQRAIAIVEQFKEGVRSKEDCENYNFSQDEELIAIWVAREALRSCCPHLAGMGEKDLSEEFEALENEQPN